MADKDGFKNPKDFHLDQPAVKSSFYVKGASDYGWGMKKRLSNIFQPDGKSVMLAFDHGYIMGPITGLERPDIVIPPLMGEVDCLMGTRGVFRSCLTPDFNKCHAGLALRASAGSSVLKEDMSKEEIGASMEDALRLNADCVAIQTFIGSDNECATIKNLTTMVDLGYRYDMPVLGVVAVGKQMERTTRFFLLATRMLAEFGAQIVKSYYCENFEQVAAACPVPIVVAGGKKVPEKDALDFTYRAISEGAAGVDMGRNVFQAESPAAMVRAISAVVHRGMTAEQAYEFYLEALSKER